MKDSCINIRQAQKSDSTIIAHAVAMAIGDEDAVKNYCGDNYIALSRETTRLMEELFMQVRNGIPVHLPD